jgi:hypothetical protein
MQAASAACSLFDVLGSVPDPRGRQGRRCPVGSLLAVLALAAMNGDSSLRDMWLLSKAHTELLTARLSFNRQCIPALETFKAWPAACDAERISLVAAPPGT